MVGKQATENIVAKQGVGLDFDGSSNGREKEDVDLMVVNLK